MPDYESDTPAALTGAQVRDLYEELRGQYSARNAELHDLGQVYRGTHWDGDKLRTERGRYSLTFNYVASTVEKAVENLVGIMPAIQVLPPGVNQAERDLAEQLEAVLYGTWQANRMDQVLRRIAHNVVLKRSGHLYMWWDPKRQIVRYRSIAPENYYPVMDGDEVVECVVVSTRNTRLLKRAYPELATKILADAERDEINSEDPTDSPSSGGMAQTTKVIDWFDRHGNWVRVMGDAPHSQKLGYGIDRVPVYDFVNNLPGDEGQSRSEVEDIIELNRYYDQLISQQADIIRKYSNPPVLNEDTGNSNTEVQRAVRGDGSVIMVKKGGVLKYLNWEGTLPEIGAQVDRVKDAIHDLSGKPASAYGQTVTNQSGVVTNMALTPTVSQTTARETLMGATLSEINSDTLKLYERFMKGERITFKGRRAGRTPYQHRFFKVEITGNEIAGWYENRMKWPSAYRVDDPVYVQNILQQAQGDHPVLPIYDALEDLGREDVEATLDRLAMQLEDPRFHPDRLKMAVDAASSLAGIEAPGGDLGLGGGGGLDAEDVNDAAEAVGSPDRAALVNGI